MQQFLFVVEVPPTPPGANFPTYADEYKGFADNASAILGKLKNSDCIPLGNTAWLLSGSTICNL